MKPYDVQVRGTGLVGHALALSLARIGLRVALVAPPPPVAAAVAARGPDVRAYALNAASVDLLRVLKVWEALPPNAATAVHEMRVHGDAPGAELDFSSWEQRVGELAWIVDAAVLERELAQAVRFSPHVTAVGAATGMGGPEAVQAALTAICEGKASTTRETHHVTVDRRPYGHRAIAARLTCSKPHTGAAWQWFRSPDVLGLLPFDTPQPALSYALVWSVPDARADALLAMNDAEFTAALMEATGGAAGDLQLASERAVWPLQRAQVDTWCGPGWVLLGDAAHVVHPLAGQGLNLGLADVAALTDVLAAREPWRDLGDERLLRRFVRQRLWPTRAMVEITDGLLHLFAHPAPLARELRNRGLTLVNRLAPIKRWLTARALDS
ncbi:MAG: FAD-dependent monooxygenase [Burkholderiaceae bacterium]|nr:FAD-dependent monooxygenase [Burkholderiaceae bacterium]